MASLQSYAESPSAFRSSLETPQQYHGNLLVTGPMPGAGPAQLRCLHINSGTSSDFVALDSRYGQMHHSTKWLLVCVVKNGAEVSQRKTLGLSREGELPGVPDAAQGSMS